MLWEGRRWKNRLVRASGRGKRGMRVPGTAGRSRPEMRVASTTAAKRFRGDLRSRSGSRKLRVRRRRIRRLGRKFEAAPKRGRRIVPTRARRAHASGFGLRWGGTDRPGRWRGTYAGRSTAAGERARSACHWKQMHGEVLLRRYRRVFARKRRDRPVKRRVRGFDRAPRERWR